MLPHIGSSRTTKSHANLLVQPVNSRMGLKRQTTFSFKENPPSRSLAAIGRLRKILFAFIKIKSETPQYGVVVIFIGKSNLPEVSHPDDTIDGLAEAFYSYLHVIKVVLKNK